MQEIKDIAYSNIASEIIIFMRIEKDALVSQIPLSSLTETLYWVKGSLYLSLLDLHFMGI